MQYSIFSKAPMVVNTLIICLLKTSELISPIDGCPVVHSVVVPLCGDLHCMLTIHCVGVVSLVDDVAKVNRIGTFY